MAQLITKGDQKVHIEWTFYHSYLVLFLIFIFSGLQGSVLCQTLEMDKGTIGFFAAAPIENIDGVSDSIIATYAVAEGKITFRVTMTSFDFKRSLMKEHFNDKYIESQKYPVASFTGTIRRTASDTLNAEVTGRMTIHGVTRQVKTIGTLTQNGEGFTVFAQFVVMLEDYGVEPPRLFWKDITDQVLVTVEGEFRKGGY